MPDRNNTLALLEKPCSSSARNTMLRAFFRMSLRLRKTPTE